MLARLGSWIKDFTEDEAAAPAGDAEWAQTLAGLLVEAAMAGVASGVATAPAAAPVINLRLVVIIKSPLFLCFWPLYEALLGYFE